MQVSSQVPEKDSMIEKLQSHCETCEASLAALSATCQPSAPSVEVQACQDELPGANSSVLEAVQALSSRIAMISGRMDSFERGSNRQQEHQSFNAAVSSPT